MPPPPAALKSAASSPQLTVRERVAMRVSQHRDATGIDNALHRRVQSRPACGHVAGPATLEPAIKGLLHIGADAVRRTAPAPGACASAKPLPAPSAPAPAQAIPRASAAAPSPACARGAAGVPRRSGRAARHCGIQAQADDVDLALAANGTTARLRARSGCRAARRRCAPRRSHRSCRDRSAPAAGPRAAPPVRPMRRATAGRPSSGCECADRCVRASSQCSALRQQRGPVARAIGVGENDGLIRLSRAL